MSNPTWHRELLFEVLAFKSLAKLFFIRPLSRVKVDLIKDLSD